MKAYMLFAIWVGLLAGNVWGLESELSVLIDADNDTQTGCEVATPAGDMNGVDGRIDLLIESDDAGFGEVTSAVFRSCISNAEGFSAASALPGNIGQIAVGLDGFNAVEVGLASPFGEFAEGGVMRLGVLAANENGAEDVLLSTAPGDQSPILLLIDAIFIPLPVPVNGVFLVLSLVLLVLMSGAVMMKYRKTSALAMVGLTGLVLAQGAGLRFDWNEPPLAESSATDPTSGVDIRAVFAQARRHGSLHLAFRVDMALEAEPVNIEVQGSPMTLPTNGPPSELTFVNLSSAANALDIDMDLTGTALEGEVTITENSCASVPPGGSCTIALQAGADPVAATELFARGSNTIEVSVEVVVVYGSVLTIDPTELSIIAGQTDQFEVSNAAEALQATSNLDVNIPDGSGLSLVNYDCPSELAPGDTCTFEVTADDPEGPTTLTVSAANAESVSADVTVNPVPQAVLSVAPTMLFFEENSTGQLTVTNDSASPVAAENVEANIPAGSGLAIQSTTCGASLAIGSSCEVSLAASDPEGPTDVAVSGDNTNTVVVSVTVTPEEIALGVSGSPLLLTVNGPTGSLTINNLSANNTALNIHSDFTGTALEGNVTETGSTCASVTAGGSCTLTFTPGNTVVPQTNFTIQGNNTQAQIAAIAIESGSTLTAINPSSGTASGGTGVTLTGTGLTGATAVQFGGIPATSVNLVNSTTVTAVTPANLAGTVDVVIETPAGNATLADGYTYVATAVGQASGGGTIACLNGGLNNLIAATADNTLDIEWGAFGTAVGAAAQSNTDGASNTAAIVSALGNNGGAPYAAQLCNDFGVDSQGNVPCQAGNTCYDDWFLPAGDNLTATGQLNCLFTNRVDIGGFATGEHYWSSTEFTGDPTISAWVQFFGDGLQWIGLKTVHHRVRCVRAFTP